VIERLQELASSGSIGLAYLYGDYRDQKEQSTENILGSMVKQLLGHLADVPWALTELYDEQVKQERPFGIKDAERLLDITCNQFSKVYICLDALDELRDPRTLLEFLHSRPPSMQVFFTGRPHVRQILQKSFKVYYDILIEAHEGDIRQFIDREIGGPNDLEPDAMDERLRMDIHKKVLGSAKGM
jgi:hypothetical protein